MASAIAERCFPSLNEANDSLAQIGQGRTLLSWVRQITSVHGQTEAACGRVCVRGHQAHT